MISLVQIAVQREERECVNAYGVKAGTFLFASAGSQTTPTDVLEVLGK